MNTENFVESISPTRSIRDSLLSYRERLQLRQLIIGQVRNFSDFFQYDENVQKFHM